MSLIGFFSIKSEPGNGSGALALVCEKNGFKSNLNQLELYPTMVISNWN